MHKVIKMIKTLRQMPKIDLLVPTIHSPASRLIVSNMINNDYQETMQN